MRWTAIAVAGGLVLAACAGQPASPGANFSVGSAGATYALATVEGKALPANAYFGVDVSVNATSGKLTLDGDHSYTLTVEYDRHFASGNRDVLFTQAEQGSWGVSGSLLTLTPAGGTAHKATVAGNEISFSLTVPDSSPPERATKTYAFAKS